AEVALDPQAGVDVVAEPGHLLVGEVPDPGVGAGVGGLADLVGPRAADAVDVGEGDLEPLLPRDVHTGYAGHGCCLLSAACRSGTGLAMPGRVIPDAACGA